MRLNGVMLEGPELASFYEMRKRLYLAPPPQCTTPPIEKQKIPSSLLVSLTGPRPLSSNVWSTWSTSSDTDKAHDPTLSVNPTLSTHDPWTFDAQDTEAENLPASGESSTWHHNVCFFYYRPTTMVDVERIFIETFNISCVIEGVAELPPQ